MTPVDVMATEIIVNGRPQRVLMFTGEDWSTLLESHPTLKAQDFRVRIATPLGSLDLGTLRATDGINGEAP